MANGGTSLPTYLTGAVAVIALMGNVIMFVWQGGRSDVTALEGRLDRAIAQLSKEIGETKNADQRLLTKEVHAEFKTQIERQIFRNTQVIDDLLVKKEVFERSQLDQRVRDGLVQSQHDKDMDMLRARMTMLRNNIDELQKYLRDKGTK